MERDKIKAKAKNNAYMLLRQRPRSEFELACRLKLKGYEGSVIEAVIADLKRTGGIDDEKFARFWIESRMHLAPVGDVVLRHELKEKGVEDNVIEAALTEKGHAYNEYELAFNMARERFNRLKRLDASTSLDIDPERSFDRLRIRPEFIEGRSRRVDRRKALKRLYDFLLRRGFQYETIRRIVDVIARNERSE